MRQVNLGVAKKYQGRRTQYRTDGVTTCAARLGLLKVRIIIDRDKRHQAKSGDHTAADVVDGGGAV